MANDAHGDETLPPGSEEVSTARLLARLGQLETRLEMLETSLSSEVDRINLTAGTIDSVTEEFRSTVGSMDALVALGERLDARLTALDRIQERIEDQDRVLAQIVGDRVEAAVERLAAQPREADHDRGIDLAPVIDAVRHRLEAHADDQAATAARLERRLDALGGELRDVSELRAEVTGLHDRLDRLAPVIAGAVTGAVEDLRGNEQHALEIDDLRQDLLRATAAVADVGAAVGPALAREVDDRIATLHDATASVLAGLEQLASAVAELRTTAATPPSGQPDGPQIQAVAEAVGTQLDHIGRALAERIDALGQELSSTQGRVRSAEELVDALGESTTEGLLELRDLLRSVRSTAEGQAQGQQQVVGALRALVARGTEPASPMGGAVTELVREIAALRADLDVTADEVAATRGEVAASRAELAATRDDVVAVRDDVVSVRDELASARDDVVAVRQDVSSAARGIATTAEDVAGAKRDVTATMHTVGSLLDEVDRMARGDATQANVAATLGRLEARLHGEFGTVGHQVEALAVLLGQSIEALHRVETTIVGPQPSTHRMRHAAAQVVSTLRANVRQRELERAWTGSGGLEARTASGAVGAGDLAEELAEDLADLDDPHA